MTSDEYREKIAAWRRSRDSNLRAENSWLALSGLFWFHEGDNTFGSGTANDITLKNEKVPDHMGVFNYSDGIVFMEITSSVVIKVDGQPKKNANLLPDTSGKAQEVSFGDLTMTVIERDDQFGLRVWDNSRPERLNFPGRDWYPIDEGYYVKAKYRRHEEPVEIHLERTIGSVLKTESDGILSFKLGEFALELITLTEEDDSLFLIFKDLTSGSETYPAGRYLTTDPPDDDGDVTIDFNRAYFPPCAFTSYATCVLPPSENNLMIKIEAGERSA
jgi:uncharacterized protein (DUF1684 family)